MNQPQTSLRRITIEDAVEDSQGNGVRFITFNDRCIIDDNPIQEIGNELLSCFIPNNPNYNPTARFCIDFKGVDFVSSALIKGKFPNINQKQKALYQRALGIVNLRPEIYEVLAITRLDGLFEIKDTREDYLRW